MWLAKPEAPQDAQSVAVMRWAIEEDATREGSLAGECLAAARAAGLSAENTYVFLAYQLLLRFEEQQQRHMYLSEIAPFVEQRPPSQGVAARLAELARNAVGRVLRLDRASTEPTDAGAAVGQGH